MSRVEATTAHSIDAEVGHLEQVLGRALDDRDEELGDEAEDLEPLARAFDASEELSERGVRHPATVSDHRNGAYARLAFGPVDRLAAGARLARADLLLREDLGPVAGQLVLCSDARTS